MWKFSGEFEKAAKITPRVFGQNAKDWEDCVFIFAKKKQLQVSVSGLPKMSTQLLTILVLGDNPICPYQRSSAQSTRV